jgi:hypothetical protein
MCLMGELTRIQLSEMAELWREMARNLTAWQATYWHELTTIQHFDLNAYQNSLLTRAQDLDERAYLLLAEPTEPTFVAVLEVVRRATQLLQTTSNKGLVLNIGALAVALAAGVSRNNSRSIELTMNELKLLAELIVVS